MKRIIIGSSAKLSVVARPLALACFALLILFGIPQHAFGQGASTCSGVRVAGPLNVESQTGTGFDESKAGYKFDAQEFSFDYGSNHTCSWNISAEGQGAESTEASGAACGSFAVERSYDSGTRVSATYTISDETGVVKTCVLSGFSAGDITIDTSLALETEFPSVGGETLDSSTSIGQAIRYFFIFGVSIIGIVALLNLVIAGAQWTSAGGNANLISAAKKRVVATLSGVVLLLASYLILITINPEFVQLREPRLTGFVPAADCNAIRSCTDYPDLENYDFESGTDGEKQQRIAQKACNLDACNVVRGGCKLLDDAPSPETACQPRILAGENLYCGGAKNLSNSINSCEQYGANPGIGGGNENFACGTDICGVGTSQNPCVVLDTNEGSNANCGAIDCSLVSTCEDYDSLFLDINTGFIDGLLDRAVFSRSVYEARNNLCLNNPCNVPGVCTPRLAGNIITDYVSCQTQ